MKLLKTLVLLCFTQVLLGQSITDKKMIWVKGEAISNYKPSHANIIYTLKEESEHAQASKENFNTFLNELFSEAHKSKLKSIKKNAVITPVDVTKLKVYNYKVDQEVKYKITQTLVFKLDFNSLNKFTNLVNLIANNYSFDITLISKGYWNEHSKEKDITLLNKAIANAKEKAAIIAKTTNTKLGEILFVREGYSKIKFQGFEKNYYGKTNEVYNGNAHNTLMHSYSVEIGFAIE